MYNLETTKVKGCPVCNQTMIRPVAVYVVCGNIIYTITRGGFEQEECADTYGRGVKIIREYVGECGHRWRDIEEFHKGSVYQRANILYEPIGPKDVIWRD